MRLSLAQRILAITAAALLPILAILVFNEISLRAARGREIHDLALATARQAALEMERVTKGAEGILRAIVTAPSVASFNAELCNDYLVGLKGTLPQFTTIVVFDLAGASRCRSDRNQTSLNFSDRPYFIDAVAARGKLVVADYTVSRLTGLPSLPIALAMLDEGGNPKGVVATGLNLDWLGDSLQERQMAKNASLTVADRNGTIIARQPQPGRFVGTKIPDAFQSLVHATEPGTIELTSQDGTRRVLGYIPAAYPPRGLYISAGISRDEAFREIDRATKRSAFVAAVASAVAVLLSWLLGRSLVRGPVQRITRVLAARRAGDDSLRTGMRVRDGDLEALGAEFDAYMDQINSVKTERDLAEQHRALLAQELSHRMKNMIATIQAIAVQTFKRDGTSAERLSAFNSRLAGLANAQQQLLFDRSEEATIRDALLSSTSLFEASPGDRFTLSGPDLPVNGQVALKIAMAAHELCTNAIKYGSLSVEGGKVNIVWTPKGTGNPVLRLEWVESGGPPAVAPKKTGFGHLMIQRILTAELNGSAEMDFQPSGLRCVIEFPLTALAARHTASG